MVGGGDLESMLVYDDIIGSSLDNLDDILDFNNEETQMLLEQSPAFPWQEYLPSNSQFPLLPADDKAADKCFNDSTESGDLLCDDLDMVQLEWLSSCVEESFSPESIDLPVNPNIVAKSQNHILIGGLDKRDELQYRTPSPVSVLEHTGVINVGNVSGSTPTYSSSSSSSSSSFPSPTSSSCSGLAGGLKVLAPLSPPETVLVRGRAPRTKRSRPNSFSRPSALVPFTTAAASDDFADGAPVFIPVPKNSASPDHENFSEFFTAPARFQNELPAPVVHSKKKKPKISPYEMAEGDESGSGSDTAGGGGGAAPVRKCMHCEITKTPQWRAGPMGPKTLCNACGVRYKSGRLFPEYRPAASPTFVETIHSNSHKKVVEMRNKTITKIEATAPVPVSAKACELLNYIRGGNSNSNSSSNSSSSRG